MNEIVVSLVAVVIAVASLVVAFVEMRVLRLSQENQNLWDRKVKALEYSLVREERLREARVRIDEAFSLSSASEPPSAAVLESKFDECPELRTHVLNLLGHWENLALGIYEGVVNEFVAYEMVAGTVIDHTSFFQNFIRARQEANPRAYRYLLYLERDWRDCREEPEALEEMRREAAEWRPGHRRRYRSRRRAHAERRSQPRRSRSSKK